MNNKLIALRINKVLYDDLQNNAKKSHRSMSQYIRDLILTGNHPMEPSIIQTVEEAKIMMEQKKGGNVNS